MEKHPETGHAVEGKCRQVQGRPGRTRDSVLVKEGILPTAKRLLKKKKEKSKHTLTDLGWVCKRNGQESLLFF